MELRNIVRNSRPPVKISPAATVGDALMAMMENKTDYLLIDRTGPNDAYGIITRWDIVEGAIANGVDITKASVLDHARKPLVTLNNLDLDIRWVAKKMSNENVSKIAVFDREEFLGFVSDIDVMKAAAARSATTKMEGARR